MSATPRRNPFRPGVGTPPLYLAGRDLPIGRFRAMLRSAPELPANMRVIGLRGVGKTVLLGEFQSVAEKSGWAAAQLEIQPGHNTDQAIVDSLSDLASRVERKISNLENVKKAVGDTVKKVGSLGLTWNEFTLTYEPFAGDQREDLTQALFSLVETSVSTGHAGCVLLLDEAQILRDESKRDGEHPLSLVIASISMLQRQGLAIGLVLCGLPTLTGNLLKARTYTERMFRGEEIGSLTGDEAREAFVAPLKESSIAAEDELIDEVVGEVEGYPYFIQLWGAELWDAAERSELPRLNLQLLDYARPEIYRRLDLDFYEPRIATLTPAEQDILLASGRAPYPPLVVSQLNESTKKSSKNVNVLLGRLVEQGVLYRIRKGEYEYTAPRFRDYLQRRAQAHQREEKR